MCEPILVTLLKMRPHSSQSSHENATPSSSTSPLDSYKEVPPPPAPRLFPCHFDSLSFLSSYVQHFVQSHFSQNQEPFNAV